MIRKHSFVEGEYYHIYHRGNQKRDIFFDDGDRKRFLALSFLLQPLAFLSNIGGLAHEFMTHANHRFADGGNYSTALLDIQEAIKHSHRIEMVSFALMNNHFHFILRAGKDGSISKYMQRLLNAYTKYINAKYEMSGHLFQGPFGAKPIGDNEQLLITSAYIHNNPAELGDWAKKITEYPWSSLQDYTKDNRWSLFLSTNAILEQFKSVEEYEQYCDGGVGDEYGEELNF